MIINTFDVLGSLFRYQEPAYGAISLPFA